MGSTKKPSSAFGAMIRHRMLGHNPAMRQAYVRLFVAEVVVSEEKIVTCCVVLTSITSEVR